MTVTKNERNDLVLGANEVECANPIRNPEAIAIETDSNVGHIPHATKRKFGTGPAQSNPASESLYSRQRLAAARDKSVPAIASGAAKSTC
jgi:hypothetical protein